MNPSSYDIALLEVFLLVVQNMLQILNLNVIACVLHPSRPLDLTINPDELSTILALLSRRSSQGHQCVCSTNQRSHEAILDIIWLLSESQIARHAERIVGNARWIRIDIEFTASALSVSGDERVTATSDNSKRCRYRPGSQIFRGECCRQSTNVIRARLLAG